ASEPAPYTGHPRGGEIAISSGTDVNVLNNVMFGSAGVPVVFADMKKYSTSVNWDYNILFNGTDTAGVGSHDLRVDPKFVLPAALDFHLQSSSPAKASGTSKLAPSRDFDGVARPSGSISRGAYQ